MQEIFRVSATATPTPTEMPTPTPAPETVADAISKLADELSDDKASGWPLWLQVLLPVVAAAGTALLVSWLSRRHDRDMRWREEIRPHLIDAAALLASVEAKGDDWELAAMDLENGRGSAGVTAAREDAAAVLAELSEFQRELGLRIKPESSLWVSYSDAAELVANAARALVENPSGYVLEPDKTKTGVAVRGALAKLPAARATFDSECRSVLGPVSQSM